MQPAYYENLEEIQKKLWSLLDDAVINRSSPFRIPVFTCADQNDIDGRIVVLRKSDKKNNVLQFHTDLRSPTVNILKKNKNASLLFYDKEEKIQLRVKVICEINNKNSLTISIRVVLSICFYYLYFVTFSETCFYKVNFFTTII